MGNVGKVAIIMGSKSDWDVVKPAAKCLKSFGIDVEARVISAHRTPEEAHEFSVNAINNGIDCIIGVAGKAAHLAGVIAGNTILPVIALPIATSVMGGMDSLLSMVQMPSGVPVATVAINGGENAGLLAVQILALKYPILQAKLSQYKDKMRNQIIMDDKFIIEELKQL